MIDLHCHVLPGIDDGPITMQGTIALARVAEANGIRTLVATPHVNATHVNDAEGIARAVAEVRDALAQEGVPVEVAAGAEVALGRAAALDDDELAGLRLGDGPWLLLECPLSPAAAAGFPAAALQIAARGHRVLLAHPERSPAFHPDPAGRLGALVAEGMLTQVTAGAFTGRFGRRVQEVTLELLRAGLVHVVASDAHDAVGRPPSIAAELAHAGVEAWAGWLAHDVPAAILAGGPIPPAPAPATLPAPDEGRRPWWRRRR
jgi:protein-tyrosine phosphatase